MRASVVMPTYGRPDLLRRALTSLNGQTARGEFEVVVVDDGSPEPARRVAESLSLDYPCRTLWQPHAGFRAAKARNTGILFGTGDVVIFLDDDMVVDRRFVETHLAVHAQRAETAVIGLRHRVPHAVWAEGEGDPAQWLASGVMDPRAATFTQETWKKLPWAYFATCHASVARDALIQGGMFDEGFVGWGLEDTELAYRLHRIGLNFVSLADCAAFHLEPGDHDMTTVDDPYRISTEKLAGFIRNGDYFIDKYPDDPAVATLLAREQRLRLLACRGESLPAGHSADSGAVLEAIPPHQSLLTPYSEGDRRQPHRSPARAPSTGACPSMREELELTFGIRPESGRGRRWPSLPEPVWTALLSPVVAAVALGLIGGMMVTGRYRRIFRRGVGR